MQLLGSVEIHEARFEQNPLSFDLVVHLGDGLEHLVLLGVSEDCARLCAVNDLGCSSANVGDKGRIVNHASAIVNPVPLDQIVDLCGVEVDVESGETSAELYSE